MSDNFEKELNWDDQIEKESDFTLLPEGDYDFTVKSFARGRHNGSDKLPACNKAIIKLEVTNGTNSSTIEHNLFLHSKCEGILSSFFISIGQKKHGEPLKMNWNAVTGARGKCKIYIDKWQGKNGQEMESNKIKKFLELEPAENAPQAKFTPGAF